MELVDWLYTDNTVNEYAIRSHDDLHEDCTDIVYRITYEDGTSYVGKKTVRSISTLPKLKNKVRENVVKEITKHVLRDEDGHVITSKKKRKEARDRGLKAKAEVYEKVVTNKPFINYTGSSMGIPSDLKIVDRSIIYQCSNKRTATYLEAKLLFMEDAVVSNKYRNENILGSFFDNALEGLINV
jgi:hypothetical protein